MSNLLDQQYNINRLHLYKN